MNMYDVIQTSIRLMPVLILLMAYVYLLRFAWHKRIVVMFLLGWLVVGSTTMLYWHYSITYAPSPEVQLELAQQDGGAQMFGVLFGWAFGLALLCIFEAARWVVLGVSAVRMRLKGSVSGG